MNALRIPSILKSLSGMTALSALSGGCGIAVYGIAISGATAYQLGEFAAMFALVVIVKQFFMPAFWISVLACDEFLASDETIVQVFRLECILGGIAVTVCCVLSSAFFASDGVLGFLFLLPIGGIGELAIARLRAQQRFLTEPVVQFGVGVIKLAIVLVGWFFDVAWQAFLLGWIVSAMLRSYILCSIFNRQVTGGAFGCVVTGSWRLVKPIIGNAPFRKSVLSVHLERVVKLVPRQIDVLIGAYFFATESVGLYKFCKDLVSYGAKIYEPAVQLFLGLGLAGRTDSANRVIAEIFISVNFFFCSVFFLLVMNEYLLSASEFSLELVHVIGISLLVSLPLLTIRTYPKIIRSGQANKNVLGLCIIMLVQVLIWFSFAQFASIDWFLISNSFYLFAVPILHNRLINRGT